MGHPDSRPSPLALPRAFVACLAPLVVPSPAIANPPTPPSTGTQTSVLDPVLVTAPAPTAAPPLALAESPVRTEILRPADLPFAVSPKLSDLLDYQPGLRVESNCQNCNASELRVLGLAQSYLAITTDGLLTVSGLAGVYGLEQIPTTILDRIEITKGGGSVLHGPGAVAGSLNLVPRDPTHTHFDLDATWHRMEGRSSGDRPNTDVVAVFETMARNAPFGVIAYGLQSFVQGIDLNRDRFTEVTRRDLYGGGLRTVYRPSPEVRLALDYFYSFENRRGGEDGPALDLPDHETFLSEHLESARHVGLLTWDHEVSDAFDYRLGFAAARTDRDSYYGGVGPLGYAPPGTPDHDPRVPERLATRFPEFTGAFDDPSGPFYRADWSPALGYGTTGNLLLSTDLLAHRHFGEDHTLSAGYQFRSESIDDRTGLGRTFRDRYENHGLLLQHTWRMSDPWEVVYGIRGDHHSAVQSVIPSPRAAILYRPTPDFDLRFGAATGFRAPELFDEDLHISNVGGELVVVSPHPDLREERSHAFHLSPVWRFAPGWELGGHLFHTGLQDTFFTDLATDDPDTPGVIEATKINAGRAEIFGAESSLLYRTGRFAAELGYVEQRSRFAHPQVLLGSPDDPLDPPVTSRRFARTPDRYGVAKITWDDRRWRAFVAARITGPMDVPHVVNHPTTGELLQNELARSPWFVTVDLGAARTWTLGGHHRLTLQAGVKNVFNEYQDDLDAGPFRDPAYVYGTRFPRTWYAGLTLAF
ncbi:MAG: TonB-dependent receptor [Verrucomicrobiae bacterium]|nr:TonB-dependent receptor [Verrucomicrobiae bacterium]